MPAHGLLPAAWVAALNKLSWSPLRRRRGVASKDLGATVSGRDRRGGGGDFAGDFCSPSSSASRQCLLQRRREDGRSGSGALVVGLSRPAVGWLDVCSVLGLRPVVGGSRASPRPRRLVELDSEVEGELGVDPRPACHSDMWAPSVLLLVVHKARWRWSFFNLGCGGLRLLLSRCFGVAGERRVRSGGAEFPEGFVAVLFFFRGLSAICTGLRVLLDRICSLCTYSVLRMSST
jgi:hypothetical protein